jgi:DNA polymerase II large subunit
VLKPKRKPIEERRCTACGVKYKAMAMNATYCKSCRTNAGTVSLIRLLNFAVKLLGISASELKEKFKEHNLKED